MPRPSFPALLAALCMSGAAAAHPHVFVDAEVGFAIDGSTLSALRIAWTYDEFTSLLLFDVLGLDLDGDGILNEGDLAKVAAGETDWPEEYEGDVYLVVGPSAIPLARPSNASAKTDGDRITVRFDLPLEAPLEMSANTAILRIYDPTYYYAYSVTGAAISASSADDCSATIVPFKADAATAALRTQLAALSREQSPEQPDVGRLFADEVVLKCR